MDREGAVTALPRLSEFTGGHEPSSLLHGSANLEEGGLGKHTLNSS